MFEKLHGLCDIIVQDKKTFPAEYCKNEYSQIEFDRYKGVVYHRLTGAVTTREDEAQSTVACDPFYVKTFPLKTIVGIDKKYLKAIGNDSYLENKIANNLVSAIADTNNKQLRIDLKADSISINVNRLSLIRDDIFKEEYSGIDNFIRYEFLYVSIEYDVEVSGSVSCFKLYQC